MSMTTITNHWWQKAYDAAVLEMDSAQVPSRVVEASKAIAERLRSCIVYGSMEHLAIVDARRWLATLSLKRR
jgi:hypothetical protein